jgi:prepilin-type N-terminal cleavage/methylation domain-containing protein
MDYVCSGNEDMSKEFKHFQQTGFKFSGKEKKRAGVTLVETMVALLVLGVFITGSSKILMAHRKLADTAREHYAAINIAKNRIELVRTFEFGQVNDFLESNTNVDQNGAPDDTGNFRRSTTMTLVSSNLIEMVVNVEIRDRVTLKFDGEGEKLTTYFAEYLTEDSAVGSG